MRNREKKIYQYIKTGLIAVVLAMIAQIATGQDSTSRRILFVGNSFTYFYNLPQVVDAMAKSMGYDWVVRSSTHPGVSLADHWNGAEGLQTREMIENGKWDYVVLNNYSLGPIKTAERFMEYSKKFVDLIREHGGKPVFMMTWAYRNNPLMQEKISEMYHTLALETGADLVPAGELFRQSKTWRPDLNLFFDFKHPSENGTYLLGLAFLKYFVGQSIQGIPRTLTTYDRNGEKLYLLFMHQEDVDFLQQMVDAYEYKTTKLNKK